MADILSNVYIWYAFRKLIDIFFGMYQKRIRIMRNAGITDRMSVIDIACGTGQYNALTKGKYLGIDLNGEYIDYARGIYKEDENRKFICADINTLSISDYSYDVALLIDVVHHLTDEENQVLFGILNRVATHFMVVCDPIKQSRYNLIGRLLTALDRGKYIRAEENLLDLIKRDFNIESVINLKIMGIENICVIAKPKK